MFRNSRKRKAMLEEQKKQMVPGAEIMTNFGLFGTLVSVDEVTNVAEVEVTPGTIVKVHRQTLSKVVTPDEIDSDAPRSVEEAMERANREAAEREADSAKQLEAQDEPQFGERTTTDTEKPARRATKKSTD